MEIITQMNVSKADNNIYIYIILTTVLFVVLYVRLLSISDHSQYIIKRLYKTKFVYRYFKYNYISA